MTATPAPTVPAADPRRRVHLIYPHGDRTSQPDAIGRELGRRLEARYEVIYHDWFDLGVIIPEPGDVLLGHPHPDPRSVFRRSLRQNGWSRRLALAPFHHGDLRQNAFEEPILRDCDLFLAITGPYWFRTIEDSPCSHWRPKMVHLDLAIDRNDYPPVKRSFAEAGKRRVLYIGRKGRGKGTPYLSEIAALLPNTEFAWMGRGSAPIPGLAALGFVDYGSPAGREILAGFDFFLTVGNADANPTTILEAMAWGLIPICTPTSGYDGIPSIANVPLDDAPTAATILRGLLAADDTDLTAMQSANWKLLDDHYNWDRFAAVVTEAIESAASPALLPESWRRRLIFTFYDITSPYGRVANGRLGRSAATLNRKCRSLAGRIRGRLHRTTGG